MDRIIYRILFINFRETSISRYFREKTVTV